MLLASVTGMQSLNPAQPMLTPEQGGIDFAQILGGLIGSGSVDENNILASLTETEIGQVNTLLGQTKSSGTQLLPFDIPVSNPEQAGQSEQSVNNNTGNFMQTAPEQITADPGNENLILKPGENEEINIGRLIDSPFAYDRGSNLSAQGGRSVFSEMLNAEDLEQLAEGESLTIKLPYNNDSQKTDLTVPELQTGSNNQNVEEITFTKLPDTRNALVQNASCFEVSFKSGENSSQVQAVLLNDNSESQIKDLQGLIIEHQGRDAKLVLSVPTEKNTTDQAAIPIIKHDQTSDKPAFDRLISEDSTAKLRQFTLQRGQVPQFEAANKTAENIVKGENGIQFKTETAVISKQNSGLNQEFAEVKQDSSLKNNTVESRQETGFNQNSTENKQDSSESNQHNTKQNFTSNIIHKADAPILNNHNIEGFAEKLSSTLNLDLQSVQTKTGEVENVDQARLQMLTRDVQFKIDQPLNRAELPEGGTFRIKMAPESLGKIEVKLEVVHDRMVARMSVDSPIAKQVVESNLHTLRDTLNQSGIKVDNISVNVSGQESNTNLSNRQTGQQAGANYNNGNYDFEADELEVVPEISDPRRNTNLQGSLSIFA